MPGLLRCNIRHKSTDEQQSSDRKAWGYRSPDNSFQSRLLQPVSVKEEESERLKSDKRIERKHKVESKKEAK